ncbi:hypothetical protein ACXYTJ_13035 [Gilvimarinus sp. F26214L]|uniref:hypothetical protein n=1 Tax=Gilvimarinus sp. DZF01 TaxID=3461371 RepID=UPI004045879C
MLTLLLKRDIARAEALRFDLGHNRELLGTILGLGKTRAVHFIGSPAGLLFSFGAGCVFGMVRSDKPGRLLPVLKSLAKPLLAEALVNVASHA